MNNAISLQELSKTYKAGFFRKRPIDALRNLTLHVDEGEAFGFVGPNGAGKSTTIKLMMGLIKPDAGSATIFGSKSDSALSRKGVAYVPESPLLYDNLTPLETLQMGCRVQQLRKPNLKEHCLEWLHKFGIEQSAHKLIRSFSKGMTQRTALAHALAMEPRLLILDEPLSGLDPIGRKEVVDILLDYRKTGGTLFFSSHVLHDVERLADRFGLIHKGELRTVQSPHELLGTRQRFLVRTVGDQNVAGMTSDAQGRWFAEVDQDALWPLLNQLQSAHHAIVEVKPSLTLETAFMRYVGAGKEQAQ